MHNPIEELEAQMRRRVRMLDLRGQRAAIEAQLLQALADLTTFPFDGKPEDILLHQARLAAIEANGVSATQYIKGAQRNGPCPCGSGKRFKRCCRKVTVK